MEHKRCWPLARILGKLVMKTTGWEIKGEVPQSSKMILIAAPHTSNWDFIYLLGAAYSFGMGINWLGKRSLFAHPLGFVMRFLGGIPVDRGKANNLVSQLAEQIREGGPCCIVIPPSGTRGYTDYWKSGFYWIAREADIPVVCTYLDYPSKTACIGPSFHLCGEVTQDMDKIRSFYAGITGKIPANQSQIRLREEQ